MSLMIGVHSDLRILLLAPGSFGQGSIGLKVAYHCDFLYRCRRRPLAALNTMVMIATFGTGRWREPRNAPFLKVIVDPNRQALVELLRRRVMSCGIGFWLLLVGADQLGRSGCASPSPFSFYSGHLYAILAQTQHTPKYSSMRRGLCASCPDGCRLIARHSRHRKIRSRSIV